MSYQAVIRTSSNALVTNTQIGMEINIRQGSPTGTVVYTETQTPIPNANVLVSIEIGGGTGFNAIDWSSGPYFIEIKTDPNGGTDYTISNISQLMSVPYALYSKTSETAKDFSFSPAASITNSQITEWNNKVSSQWVTSGNNIYYLRNVGIGTFSPSALLHAVGVTTGGGNVLFAGQFKASDPGNPPMEGQGTRMNVVSR